MGTSCRRNTREFKFVMLPIQRWYNHYYYSLFMLCYLASLVAPRTMELLATTAQGCSSVESDALLAFKSSINDPFNSLASWNSQHDCCGWSRVVCCNSTTTTRVHVVELNLDNAGIFPLQGQKLSSSLLSLTHLESLNLSWNIFYGSQIPEFIGSFQKLRYLDLQGSSFGGTIPLQLGNLSSLRYLNLQDLHSLRVESLDWLSHLSSLTFLDMSLVNLSNVSHTWLYVVNKLPSLEVLRLSACRLNQIPSSLSHLNLTSLVTLDLSSNNFNSTLPSWLWQLTALSSLFLDYNVGFYGPIPAEIKNLRTLTIFSLFDNSLSGALPNEIWSLTYLTELNLANSLLGGHIPVGIKNLTSLSKLILFNCTLGGSIPIEIGNLTSLIELDLGENLLAGLLPIEVGQLINLYKLDLSYNSLEGIVSQLLFANLTNLQHLDLSDNPLLTIEHNWVIPFQLQFLGLNSLILGPTFPIWLRSPNSIATLSLSNTRIEGNLPNWFWASFSTCEVIHLSYNKISGSLPLSLESYTNLTFLNMRSNLLEGSIPKFSVHMLAIDLSINFLLGPLPVDFSLALYFLSNNKIHERIPLSFCNSTNLAYLDLSYNKIFGEIPNCEWLKPPLFLEFLHLGNNNLSGEIPHSFGKLINIQSLHLNNNNLYGEMPPSLQSCNQLVLLDISYNKLSENIPIWIGQSLKKLKFLLLRSNMFSGDIPLNIGQLSNLQIIDLASNYLSGSIPHSLGNLSAIISTSTGTYRYAVARLFDEVDSIAIVMKGYEYSVSRTLLLMKSIDLSNNNLVGEIPKELGFLGGLQTLNLSRNHLKGNIPRTIGGMKSLETLDLSYNALSGAIPQGLSALNYLNHLNLSYNNLSGMIPQGNQLQVLQDASIYSGNAYLCGAFINKSCFGGKNKSIIFEEHKGSSQMLLDNLGIILGFLLGLWSVLVIVLFKKNWRNLYFLVIDKMYDRTYVFIKIRLNRLIISQ